MAAGRTIGDGSIGNRDRLRWRARVFHIPKHNSGNTRWFLYRDHYCGLRQPEPHCDRDDCRPIKHFGCTSDSVPRFSIFSTTGRISSVSLARYATPLPPAPRLRTTL